MHILPDRVFTLKETKMYSSIYNAPKHTGFKFELVIHNHAGLTSQSVVRTCYFNSKADAKRTAKEWGAQPWNY